MIAFDSYFELTNKPNLIYGVLNDLIDYFDHMVVAYIFWANLYIYVDSTMQYAFQPFYLEVCQNVKYRKRCMVSIVTMNLPQVYGSTLVKEMAANFTLLRQ